MPQSIDDEIGAPDATADAADRDRTDASPPHARERIRLTGWRPLLRALLLSIVAALLCALTLELSGLLGEEWRYWESTFTEGLSYVADSLVIWLVLVVLIGLTNRVLVPITFVAVTTVVIAVVNRVKLNLRYEPVYPNDVDFLSQPGFLLSQVSPVSLLVVVVLVAAAVVGLVRLGRRRGPMLAPIWPRGLSPLRQLGVVATRALVITLAIALLADATRFNEPGNPWRSLYEVGPRQWHYWDQRTNYLANGFVGGFLYNMPAEAMETPEGYDPATMDAVADRYEQIAARVNRTRTGSLDDVNVVLVLSESFTDPTRLNGFELERDPIPQTRALMKRSSAGTLLAQLYGGGTANMEFELLTGQSIGLFTPQMKSPYQMLLPSMDSYPSAVSWFADQGHTPVAVHPYVPSFYQRDQVYDVLGFDSFTDQSTIADPERIEDNEFISDKTAFDQVTSIIDDSAEPLMVNLVTMQNHIPVDGNYSDPIGVTGPEDEGQADRIGQYARGLEHTDEALQDFLADLEQSDEKTVVVFYGDHLPGIYNDAIADQNPGLGMYTTPFFLWSSEGTPQRTFPQTSPTHLLPALYEMADAPIPPYFAMLDRVRSRVPGIEQGRMLDPSGRELDGDSLDRRTQRLVDDYRLVQYDFSIGDRLVVDRMWPGSTREDADDSGDPGDTGDTDSADGS